MTNRARTLSPAHRAALSAALLGRWQDPKYRAAMSAAHQGKPLSLVHRASVSAALMGRSLTPSHRANLSAAHLGRSPTPEHQSAVTAALNRPEVRAKLSAAHLGNTSFKDATVKGTCAYCFGPATERDHVIPRLRGGTDDPSNIVLACHRCNATKGNRTPDEWLADGLRGRRP